MQEPAQDPPFPSVAICSSFAPKEQPKNNFRKVFITLRVMSAKAAVFSALQGPITRSVMATSGPKPQARGLCVPRDRRVPLAG